MMMNRLMLFFVAVAFATFCWGQNEYYLTELLYEDNFENDLNQWVIEQTADGKHSLEDGTLEVDGGGTTAWFKQLLNGPVLIEFDALLVQNGGPNDNCRDLNAFFMARHPRAPYDLFEGWRSNSKSRAGQFKNYHELRTYYFGIGGHKNTTSRFRRYTGHGSRPLLPAHDLSDQKYLLEPNKTYKIQIVAMGSHVEVSRDGEVLFSMHDPQPYTSGWFGFRTVSNHIKYDNFKVYRIAGNVKESDGFATAKALKLGKSLTQLSFRKGTRDLTAFQHADGMLSERVIFTDEQTGGQIWRMTSDLSIENNEYTDIPVWSANGALMQFITRRNGEAERWLMDADGSNLRPLTAKAKIPGDKGVWSSQEPDVVFYSEKDTTEDGEVSATRVMKVNVETGQKKVVVSVPRDLGKMMPPHPSEELFLFGDHMGGAWKDKEHESRAFVVDIKGNVSEISFEKLYHRLRFTKSEDGRVFFNFDKPRTSWTCLPDGSDRREIKINGGHPDWLEGGEWVIFNAREVLPDGTKNFDLRYDAIRYDGTGLRTIYPYGGHASTTVDGKHIVCDGGPGDGSVNFVDVDERNNSQILFQNHTSRYDHTNNWHPFHHSTHPHPNSSPDGTKVMSNSDALGQYTDIFVSVARFPDPPRNLRYEGRYIQWEPGANARETAGYHVYASPQSGGPYERLTTSLVTATRYPVNRGGETYYVVTAHEYSGLASAPSNEVQNSDSWTGNVRWALEAEHGDWQLPLAPKIMMSQASNGYLVQSRDGQPGGKLSFEIEVPKSGTYQLWGLVTGRGGLSVTINEQDLGTISGPANAMTWQKTPATMSLKKGKVSLQLTAIAGSEIIDKLVFTDDLSYRPTGHESSLSFRPDTPSNLRSSTLSTNSLAITWDPVPNAAYYQVYASEFPEFECSQNHLIGSPVENKLIDWGLKPGVAYYYKVKASDAYGTYSGASTVTTARTLSLTPCHIVLDPRDSKNANVAFVYEKQISAHVARSHAADAHIQWEFDVPVAGYYSIWGQSVLSFQEKLTFDFQLDDTKSQWKVFGLYHTWKPSPFGKNSSGSPEMWYLSAGKHQLRINVPEGKKIGKVRLTNAPDYYPVTEMKSTGY